MSFLSLLVFWLLHSSKAPLGSVTDVALKTWISPGRRNRAIMNNFIWVQISFWNYDMLRSWLCYLYAWLIPLVSPLSISPLLSNWSSHTGLTSTVYSPSAKNLRTLMRVYKQWSNLWWWSPSSSTLLSASGFVEVLIFSTKIPLSKEWRKSMKYSLVLLGTTYLILHHNKILT